MNEVVARVQLGSEVLPSETALRYIEKAEEHFRKKDRADAHLSIGYALAMGPNVMHYRDDRGERSVGLGFLTAKEIEVHLQYTEVLRRIFVLLHDLEDRDGAHRIYCQARAWATDPNCSSSIHLQKIEMSWGRLHFPKWLR